MSVIRLLVNTCRFAELGIVPGELQDHGIVCVQETFASQDSVTEAFDVALLDGNASAQETLSLIKVLRSVSPASKFMILLSDFGSNALSYLQVGATGLLTSVPESGRLAEIIGAVVNGHYHLDNDIAQLLAMRQIKKQLEPFTSLSSREFDVFCQLAEGFDLPTIASRLAISSKTVSNCQTQIKLKLAIASRDQIKKFAKSHGLLLDKSV